MPSPKSVTISEQKRFLKRMKIDAPFIDCPDCHGVGRVLESGVLFNCDLCAATGRIYFDNVRPFSLREWWRRLPAYKRINYFTLISFTCAVLGSLLLLHILDWFAQR